LFKWNLFLFNQQQLENLFHGALALAPSQSRELWLRSQTSDPALIDEVSELLAANDALTHLVVQEPKSIAPLPPSHFGNWSILGWLGRGGSGEVFRVCRAGDPLQYALKVLNSRLASPDSARLFQREAQFLSSLNHPHITRWIDGGVSPDGDLYLVMELIDGQPIDRHAKTCQLDFQARARLILQVAEALQYAHQNLILHLDLKPANIYVDHAGTAKLLDFGAGHLLAQDPSNTLTRFRPLTPRYASPEQLRGDRPTAASDVYSLAAVAFELFTGSWPFGVESIANELRRASGDLEAPSLSRSLAANPSLHIPARLLRDFDNILRKALNHDPQHRYPSVGEFATDLHNALENLPVLATGQNFLYIAGRFLTRHRWRLAAAALVLFLLSAATILAFLQWSRARRHMTLIQETNVEQLSKTIAELSLVPGTAKARMLLASNASANLDRLLTEEPANPAVRLALTQSYLQLADIQGQPFALSLGDTPAALANYRKAEHLATGPGWPTQALFLRARQGISELYIRSGRYAEAATVARASLAPFRSVWLQAPPSFTIAGKSVGSLYVRQQLILGHALLRSADLQRDVPGVRAALVEFQNAIALSKEIRSRDSREPDLAGGLAQYVGYAYDLLGNFTNDRNHYTSAASYHSLNTNAAEARFKTSPSPLAQRNLADALIYLAWSTAEAKDFAHAIPLAQRALDLMHPLAMADPSAKEAQLDLAVMYARLGAIEVRAGQLSAGIDHLSRAAGIVPLPRPIQLADRESAVLFAFTQEALAHAFASQALWPKAIAASTLAVQAVTVDGIVPAWRVQELQKKLALCRTKILPIL
jgi:eukaryotic-like serine/threonine-protein kinase